jgi:hypothetical protein
MKTIFVSVVRNGSQTSDGARDKTSSGAKDGTRQRWIERWNERWIEKWASDGPQDGTYDGAREMEQATGGETEQLIGQEATSDAARGRTSIIFFNNSIN